MYGESLILRSILLSIPAAFISLAAMLALRQRRFGRGQIAVTFSVWSLAAAVFGGLALADRPGPSGLSIAIAVSGDWSEAESREIVRAAEYWNGLARLAAGRPAFIIGQGPAGYRPDSFFLAEMFGPRTCDGLNVVAPDDRDPAASGGDSDDLGRFIGCGWHWPGGDIVVWRRQVSYDGRLDLHELNFVVRHELGHLLGLSHVAENVHSTMVPYIRTCTDDSSTRESDLLLLRRLYDGR